MHKWIDSHCHYDFDVFSSVRQQHWQWCQQQGIQALLIPGITLAQSQRLADFCRHQPWLWSVGLHPYFMAQHRAGEVEQLAGLIRPGCVAIGEFGLDYVVARSDHERHLQWQLFDQQLALAQQLKLPIILHVRKAHDQVAQRLRQRQFSYGGVVHAFTGSEQQAKAYLDCGLHLGLGGAFTHVRAQRLRRTVKALPLSAWLLETDAPDMAPAFIHRDQLPANSPAMIPLYGQLLAHLVSLPLAQIALQTTETFGTVFAQNPFDISGLN
ncbi:deoxyribonuclease [Bacterioplanes sanyensis]|uniref:TatD family hydrolase n=1 Tax=Bacterioplanes sanyensis TaxID=1249553 RepID=UPI001672D4E8|nr:TatD family hydrolase [Bacterioplanes sanyensis]GGY44273.1 deoxyribonuclease [Bacterioplanes sanyensis]